MPQKVSKTTTAQSLGVSRGSLYYKPLRPLQDELLKKEIHAVWLEHPAYGHRRIAIHLKVNKKRIIRVMRKFKLYPVLVRKKRSYSHSPVISEIPNRTKDLKPAFPNTIWVGDFTYLWYHGRYVYLATVIDSFFTLLLEIRARPIMADRNAMSFAITLYPFALA